MSLIIRHDSKERVFVCQSKYRQKIKKRKFFLEIFALNHVTLKTIKPCLYNIPKFCVSLKLIYILASYDRAVARWDYRELSQDFQMLKKSPGIGGFCYYLSLIFLALETIRHIVPECLQYLGYRVFFF